jgi:arylformamidase
LATAVSALPRWSEPVGLGAKRTRTLTRPLYGLGSGAERLPPCRQRHPCVAPMPTTSPRTTCGCRRVCSGRSLLSLLGALTPDPVTGRSCRSCANRSTGSAARHRLLRYGPPVLVDLSHVITEGMTTYPGLPGPVICDFLSREASRAHYAPDTSFQIGRIELVSNTGTYVDVPFHRYADGVDLADQELGPLAGRPVLVVDAAGHATRPLGQETFADLDVEGCAVLLRTGQDELFGTRAYGANEHPFVSRSGAETLRDRGAALVGIDAVNIDDLADGSRPAHTVLLGAGIPICEHLRGLETLPPTGARFFAVPPRFRGVGTFPVRAYAEISGP